MGRAHLTRKFTILTLFIVISDHKIYTINTCTSFYFLFFAPLNMRFYFQKYEEKKGTKLFYKTIEPRTKPITGPVARHHGGNSGGCDPNRPHRVPAQCDETDML